MSSVSPTASAGCSGADRSHWKPSSSTLHSLRQEPHVTPLRRPYAGPASPGRGCAEHRARRERGGFLRRPDREWVVHPRPHARGRRAARGARPETSSRGRVPQADYASGRANRGYRCNPGPCRRSAATGGFKVLRYVDELGPDLRLLRLHAALSARLRLQRLSPVSVSSCWTWTTRRSRGKTATLTTPAMLSPHESLLLNKKRGMIGRAPRQRRDLSRHRSTSTT